MARTVEALHPASPTQRTLAGFGESCLSGGRALPSASADKKGGVTAVVSGEHISSFSACNSLSCHLREPCPSAPPTPAVAVGISSLQQAVEALPPTRLPPSFFTPTTPPLQNTNKPDTMASKLAAAIPTHLKPGSANGGAGDGTERRHHGKSQSHVVRNCLVLLTAGERPSAFPFDLQKESVLPGLCQAPRSP